MAVCGRDGIQLSFSAVIVLTFVDGTVSVCPYPETPNQGDGLIICNVESQVRSQQESGTFGLHRQVRGE